MMQQTTLLEGIAPDADAKLKPNKLSARQMRAIKVFADQGYSPQLSTHPMYIFVDRSTGEEVKRHIKDIEVIYDQFRKEAAAERARARKSKKGRR